MDDKQFFGSLPMYANVLLGYFEGGKSQARGEMMGVDRMVHRTEDITMGKCPFVSVRPSNEKMRKGRCSSDHAWFFSGTQFVLEAMRCTDGSQGS